MKIRLSDRFNKDIKSNMSKMQSMLAKALVPIAVLLWSSTFMTNYMVPSFPQSVYAGEEQQVTWETFNDKNGLFTIQYPSNWTPTAVPESTAPIDMDFWYYGQGNTFAYTNIYATESLYSTSRESMDAFTKSQQNDGTLANYEVERATECTKYTINGVAACSIISSFQPPEEGYRAAMTVIGVDDKGTEYMFTYAASLDVFKSFLPVAEQMLKSFKVTGDLASDQSTGQPQGSELTGKEFSLDDNTTGLTNTTQQPQGPGGTADDNSTGAEFTLD